MSDDLKISGNKKRQIQELTIPTLLVTYHPLSVRNKRKKQESTILLSELMETTKKWQTYRSIAIDGMNGTGKTTLAKSLERFYIKINEFCPETTHGSEYNYNPIMSFEYLTFPRQIKAQDMYFIWDRCEWSNTIFYLVHALMSLYRSQASDTSLLTDSMANVSIQTINSQLNAIAQDTNLVKSIQYFEQFYHQDNSVSARLFLVCSNLDMIRECLTNRALKCDDTKFSPNDLFNASFVNYQLAQLYVYKYMASLLPNTICIDICDYVNDNFSLGDLQYVLKNMIDIPRNSQSAMREKIRKSKVGIAEFILSREEHHENDSCKCIQCAIKATNSLHKFININEDHVIFNYSCK